MDGVAFFLMCDGPTNLYQLHALDQVLKENEITPTRRWLLEKTKQANGVTRALFSLSLQFRKLSQITNLPGVFQQLWARA
jgi:hypothetical protein